MTSLTVIQQPPSTLAERMAHLREQAAAIGAEQVRALEAALGDVTQLAEDLRLMGDAVEPGIREVAQKIAVRALQDRAMLQGIVARLRR